MSQAVVRSSNTAYICRQCTLSVQCKSNEVGYATGNILTFRNSKPCVMSAFGDGCEISVKMKIYSSRLKRTRLKTRTSLRHSLTEEMYALWGQLLIKSINKGSVDNTSQLLTTVDYCAKFIEENEILQFWNGSHQAILVNRPTKIGILENQFNWFEKKMCLS